jgi:hypothetical protein
LALASLVMYGLQKQQTYVSGGELAKIFSNLDELSKETRSVALGVFTDRIKIVDTPWNKESKLKIVLHEFKPERMLRGSLDQSVWIGVYGMKQQDKWIGALGQALYTPGSMYVLFLQESLPEVEPGLRFFWTVGAYQGSFRVRNGAVWARSEIGESDGSRVKTHGEELESFLSRLKEH